MKTFLSTKVGYTLRKNILVKTHQDFDNKLYCRRWLYASMLLVERKKTKLCYLREGLKMDSTIFSDPSANQQNG